MEREKLNARDRTGQKRQIFATSGGMREDARRNLRCAALFDHALELSGAAHPRLCLVSTAMGDDPWLVGRAYAAFADRDVTVSHLALFPMPNVEDIGAHLLAQDVVWVMGGSVANLLALWWLHGVDKAMRTAWGNGVVLAGVSAGCLCWHVGGTTDSFGPDLRPVMDALGFLPYANGVHYDSEHQRRPLIQRLAADGMLPTAYCTDDGVGLHYVGTELVEAVSEIEGRGAYVVERAPGDGAVETRIEPRLLTPP